MGLAAIVRQSAIRRAAQTLMRLSGRDRRIIAAYLNGRGPKRLQVGCGFHPLEGWLNANFPIRVTPFSFRHNIISLDATRPFPMPDASFDIIKSEHMIEHLPYLGGAAMLRECFRVLRPGGRIRLSTPNLRFLLDLLRDPLDERQHAYVEWAGRQFLPETQPVTALAVFNNFVRDWGHQFIYDRATIVDLLGSCGFVDISDREINQSDDPELIGIDFPERLPAGFLELETMTYEARKPGGPTTTSPA